MSFTSSIRMLLVAAALIVLGQQVHAQVVWSGGANSTDWNSAGNWASGMVPAGGSQVEIPGGLTIYPTINSNVGNMNSLLIANTATLRVDPSGQIGVANAVSVSGTLRVQGGTLTHTGSSLNSRFAIAGTGSAQVTSGDLEIGSLGSNGTVINSGNMTIAAGATVTYSGNTVDLMSNNFSFVNSGTMAFSATATSMQVNFPNSPTVTGDLVMSATTGLDSIDVSGPLQVDDLTMSGGGDITFNNPVSILGSLTDTGTAGSVSFSDTLTLSGLGPGAQAVTLGGRTINTLKFWVQTNGTLQLDGDVTASSAGSGIQSAVRIAAPSTLEMRADSSITLTTNIGVPVIDVFGTFTTQGSFANRPTISGGTNQANWGVFTVQQGADVAINGLLLERFGATSQTYAMRFASSATVSLLDYLSIPDSNCTDSLIELNTSNLPPQFVGIELGGNAPFNIDARNAVVLNAPVSITPGANMGGALFGDSFEQDPSNVLNWTIPPALAIDSVSPLPTATAGQLYNPAALMASGGTGGYTWSATGMPGWLTLTPGGGQLSGTPTVNDVGMNNFTITVDDGLNQVSKAFELTVFAPGAGPVTIATNALADATEGRTYSQTIQGQNGVPPYLWTITGLPSGITADTTSGSANGTALLLGTPDFGTEGPYPIMIRIQDQVGVSDSKTITLQVNRQILVNVGVELGSSKCSLDSSGQGTWIWLVLMGFGAGSLLWMRRRSA